MNNEKLIKESIRIPTDEEMKASAHRWWGVLKWVSFAAWNKDLQLASLPFAYVKVGNGILEMFYHLHDGKCTFEELTRACTPAFNDGIKMCGTPFFIKTLTRSPKDAIADFNNHGKPKPLHTVKDAVNALADSERFLDDVCLLMHLNDFVYFVFRPFVEFAARDEWRVFVEDGKVTGISQYYYGSNFDYTLTEISNTDATLKDFMNDIVTPNMQIKSFVSDVAFINGKPVLIETNPWGMSDPCLFKSYDKLDGSIKIAK